jgi:hypothetical protein
MNGVEECDRTEGALLQPAEADRGLFGSSAIHWQVLVRPRQNKQSNTIAYELDISVGGVEVHIRRVLTNLGARDRAERICRSSHWAIMVKLAIPEQQTPPPSTLVNRPGFAGGCLF